MTSSEGQGSWAPVTKDSLAIHLVRPGGGSWKRGQLREALAVADSKISRYELISQVGRGGMSVVYRAHDPRFKREVAVKLMSRELMDDPTFRARFEREAQTIAALEHPAIVPVYDFGEDDGRPYLVMRLMTGGTLTDRLAKGALPLPETIAVLQRIGSALERAHSMGVIHRDLKPSNIMFDQYDDAFLADFGIVRVAESNVTLTGQAVIGTPAYMSPEQVYGDKEVDGRSDIYALGIICFEMLTGRRPYDDRTPAKLMMRHIMDPVPDIRTVNPNVSPDVAAVIARTMAKEPDDRFDTPTELTDTLAAAARGETPAGGPMPAKAVMTGPAVQSQAPTAGPIDKIPSEEQPAAAPVATPTSETEVSTPVTPVEPPATDSPPPAGRQGRRVPIWAWIAGGVAALIVLGAVIGAGAVVANLISSPDGTQSSEDATAGPSADEPASDSSEMADDGDGQAPSAAGDDREERSEATPEIDPEEEANALMDAFYESIEAEDYDLAIEQVSRAIELMPEESWYYHERGYAKELVYDIEAALEDYSRAIELEPENADYLVRRGSVLREYGDYPAALDDLFRAVELKPADPYGHIELGWTLHHAGDIDAAIDEFSQAIELEPGDSYFYESRANAFYEMGDLAAAIEDFDRAIEISPDNAYHYADRALMYRELEDIDMAMAGFEQAIELEPGEAWFYMEIGFTHRDWLENPEAALEFFVRASEVQPDIAETHGEIGMTLRAMGEPEAALEHFARCLEVGPYYYWCNWERAWTLVDLGEDDAAIADFEAFLAEIPDDDCPECAEEARQFIQEHS